MGSQKKGQQLFSTEATVVVVGSQACGKTSLLERFTQGTFQESYNGTVGVDNNSRIVDVDGTLVRLNLWDASGQEAFVWTIQKHLKDADAIVFTYDVTDNEGFGELSRWLQLVNQYAKARNIPKVLIGTKSDLKHKQSVTASQAKEFGIPEGMEHVEVSAKTGKNINVPFYILGRDILQWRRLGCSLQLGVPSPAYVHGEPTVVENIEMVEHDEPEYTHLFKILLVGSSRVGKTAARYRFCREYYTSEYHPTSGLEYSTRTVRIDGETVKLQVWDIGGDAAYDATRKNYYRGANGFIVMFDVTTPQSFNKASMLVKELDMYEQSDAPKVIVANKSDIASSKSRVDMNEAKSWADGWRLPLLESSARSGANIDTAFMKLAVALKRQLAPWKRLYNFDK